MASEISFDIVSRVDAQELDNALNQARKEIENRFDFKASKTSIDSDGKKITLISDDELKMRNVVDIVRQKAVRRGIDVKAFDMGEVEPAAGNTVRQTINLRNGIPKDKSKTLLEKIKSLKLKVNAQIQDDQIRVSGKSKDDLQKVIGALKSVEFDLPLQFVNYR
ncbi:MAG: YajQ family cyclic di-GMP-binding protein [Candidatus Eremiobacteraeota bacterium]|nr:YajQ family cyclic di-GMP-binding protein [Candidatus Eremiobacteraeota bacterium]MBV8285006.1 YajQ family cyclic di-GMP-binding protein [Candidatus Eremiobacteraeota bacterium]MBV8435405.1 YajQ family cyclic di-GMP-binding protein [Candidatus Eremiobacteraeota bacterium]MBV8584279.1 YajQ family cyclic di-GMP-binding protein [Candidatus Eremiobacteraeota bacterium]